MTSYKIRLDQNHMNYRRIGVSVARGISRQGLSTSGAPGCDETNECYIPYKITVHPKDKIIWSNDDTAAHTVTSGTPADGPDGNFDSSWQAPRFSTHLTH